MWLCFYGGDMTFMTSQRRPEHHAHALFAPRDMNAKLFSRSFFFISIAAHFLARASGEQSQGTCTHIHHTARFRFTACT